MQKGLLKKESDKLQKFASEIAAMPPDQVWHYFEADQLNTGNKILSRTERFVGAHAELTNLVYSATLQDILASLFGEPAVLFKDKLNYKHMGNAGFEAHQDIQAGWREYTRDFISLGIAVDPQLAEGGCLEFIPENYAGQLVGEMWKPLTPNDVDFSRFAPVPCDPGDVIFFDGCVPHRSHPNRSVSSQRIFYLTFNRQSAGDFRERYYEEKFANFPPDHYRQLGKEYAYKV